MHLYVLINIDFALLQNQHTYSYVSKHISYHASCFGIKKSHFSCKYYISKPFILSLETANSDIIIVNEPYINKIKACFHTIEFSPNNYFHYFHQLVERTDLEKKNKNQNISNDKC